MRMPEVDQFLTKGSFFRKTMDFTAHFHPVLSVWNSPEFPGGSTNPHPNRM
jgi:hypothetical protein